jgi:CheY-like chemotaxis protein
MTATSSKPCRLLIADDQPQILEALELLLEPEGFDLLRASSPAVVLEVLASEQVDGVLMGLIWWPRFSSTIRSFQLS